MELIAASHTKRTQRQFHFMAKEDLVVERMAQMWISLLIRYESTL